MRGARSEAQEVEEERTRLRRDLNNGFRYSAEVACVAAAILPCVDRLTLSARNKVRSIAGGLSVSIRLGEQGCPCTAAAHLAGLRVIAPIL